MDPTVHTIIDLESRYNDFQAEAVDNILSDYRENESGRYLLVIPTGGGKTVTAVHGVHSLFKEGVLNPEKDSVLWTAHRDHLIDQATKTFKWYTEKEGGPTYRECVHFSMIAGAADYLRENKTVRLVVIDEAHHAAMKNTQYAPIFLQLNIAILGLTATPSRHDGLPLDFEKETYSIGFPDLIDRQVIILPEIRSVVGGRFEQVRTKGAGLVGVEELENDQRDQKIIDHLTANISDYRKIIIFAASVKHTETLYQKLRNSGLVSEYQSIDYVTGNKFSQGNSRIEFIKKIKNYTRSIVINHDVLSEGYDDPKVNTIVMAKPTRSKLVYLQSIGRAIRINEHEPNKRAFIVEIEDDLPNVRYFINNRMLFSDIDDTLEPAVTDQEFGSEPEFNEVLMEMYRNFNVPEELRNIPKWDRKKRYSLLLFRSYVRADEYEHIPIVIDNINRSKVHNWFNYLSQRMNRFVTEGFLPIPAMRLARYQGIEPLDGEITKIVYWAMENAWKAIQEERLEKKQTDPWITFIAFRYRKDILSTEILDFISDMVNRDQLAEQIRTKSYLSNAQLLRIPLSLASSIGFILSKAEFQRIEKIIDSLVEIRSKFGTIDHSEAVSNLLNRSILPVDMIYRDAFPTIVREQSQYHMALE